MRLCPRFLATLGLAAFCACAAGQGVTQTGDTVNFTFTELVTRVPVSLPVSRAVGVLGSNLICPNTNVSAGVSGAGGAGPRAGAPSGPADLRAALFQKVYGKSTKELIVLRQAVQNASGRDAKVQALFGLSLLSTGTPPLYTYSVEPAKLQLLQMGQEVSPSPVNQSIGAEASSTDHKCYTTQQIDAAIDEGMQVVNAIIQALNSAARRSAVMEPGTMDQNRRRP